jgi:transposase-like protein
MLTTMELGIRRNQLYKWKEQLAVKGDAAFSGRGRPRTENQSELTMLRRENARTIRDTLCPRYDKTMDRSSNPDTDYSSSASFSTFFRAGLLE